MSDNETYLTKPDFIESLKSVEDWAGARRDEILARWAESHDVSIEVCEAINHIASSLDEMERIWNEPTGDEILAILKRIAAQQAASQIFTYFFDGLIEIPVKPRRPDNGDKI